MDQLVRVDAQHLQELSSRLTDRRIAVERELSVLGEPSKGMNDVFRHCRGFERAYSLMLQEADTSFKIRGVVEGLLPKTLRDIPIEKRFNRNYVREVCREADGYAPHLVSPEKGLRRLVQEAMRLTEAHVHRFVDEIHSVLTLTVQEAARRAVLAEHGLTNPGMEFMRLKGFENAVIIAAGKALVDWKQEAHSVADTMVRMECDYVTPSYFRELEREYQEARARARAEAEGEDGSDSEGGDDGSDSDGGDAGASRGAAITRAAGESPAVAAQGDGEDGDGPRGDVKAGWLEKHTGDSSTFGSLPLSSLKWLRRWFVLQGAAGTLAYYKNSDEFHQRAAPRVLVQLRSCVVEDWDGRGRKGDGGTNLIRIINRDPTLPVAKSNHELILRTLDAQDKAEWLAALRAAAGSAPPPPKGKGKKPAQGSEGAATKTADARTVRPVIPGQGAPGAAARDEPEPPRGLFGRSAAAVKSAGTRVKTAAGFGPANTTSLEGVNGRVLEIPTVEDLDTYYEKLGTFTGLYARSVFDRMARTVPKAIILCQVIRSRDRLLDQLYNYLSGLKPKEIDALLAEDPSVVKRRSAAQQAVLDLMSAQTELRVAQEHRASENARERSIAALVTVQALLLAGAFPLVPANAVPARTDVLRLYGPYTPVTLLAGYETGPPPKLAAPVKQLPSGPGDDGSAKAPATEAPGSDSAPSPTAGRQSRGTADDDAAPPSPSAPSAQTSSSGLESVKPRRQAPPPPPRG